MGDEVVFNVADGHVTSTTAAGGRCAHQACRIVRVLYALPGFDGIGWALLPIDDGGFMPETLRVGRSAVVAEMMRHETRR